MTEFFLDIVNMSISAGWLVLAVLVLRLILKKAPKWVNVLLWGIVAVRLIYPFSIKSALSLIPSTETISPEIMMDWTPEISTGIEPLDQVINPVISTSFAPQGMASANPLQILIPVAANLWILGVLAMLIYTAISYISLRLKLRTAVILRDNIFQCETVNSPFVLGILKPRIYLPYTMDGQNLSHVVAHEKAHIRRKDHWWKPLGFLLLTDHWFNPLMWIAYILLCQDIELACDEKVIAELGNEQRADYTQALVACSVNRRMIAACPLAFGEVGVKERVKSIMNYRKPTFWIIVTALVVCVVVAVCFLTDPREISTPEPIMDSLSTNDVEWAQVTLWNHATKHIELDDPQIKDLIGILNALDERDFVHSKVPEHPLSLMIYCGENEILLHWDGEYAEFTFDSTTAEGIDDEYRYVKNNELNLFLSQFYPIQRGTSRSEVKWFDYTEDPSQMSYEKELKIQLDEFPDITFKYTPYDIIATTSWEDSHLVGNTILISGMPIWNAYFCDLTGDGLPEICSQVSYGSGIIDSRVIIFDYANGISYKLEDRGYHDYYLRMNDADGYLYVDKRVYNSDEVVSSGRLVFKDGCIQVEGVSTEPVEISAPDVSFDENLNLGLNAEIIDIDYDQKIFYVKDTDESDAIFGTRSAIDCTYVISRNNLIYVNYGDPNDVRIIDFSDLEVGDSVIIGMYDNEKQKAFNGSAIAEQVQLSTQRLPFKTAFELKFAGNTSLHHKMELTTDRPYWCISIVNEGSESIKAELAGNVYRVEPGTSGNIYPDEAWSSGTYLISFSTAGADGMEGYVICKVSSVMFPEEEPLAWQLMIDPVYPSETE